MPVTGCCNSAQEQDAPLEHALATLSPPEQEAFAGACQAAGAGFGPSGDQVGASISVAQVGSPTPRISGTGSNYDSTGTARLCAEPTAVHELRKKFRDGIPIGSDPILALYSRGSHGGPATEKPPCPVCIDMLSRLQLPDLRVISGAAGVAGVKRWSFAEDLQPLADLTEVGALLRGGLSRRGVVRYENFQDSFSASSAYGCVTPEIWGELDCSAKGAAQSSQIHGASGVMIGVAAAFATEGNRVKVLAEPECSWESGSGLAGGAVAHLLKRALLPRDQQSTVRALLFYVDVQGDSCMSSYPLFSGVARQFVYDQANIHRIDVPIVVRSHVGCLVTSIDNLCVHYKRVRDSATWMRYLSGGAGANSHA